MFQYLQIICWGHVLKEFLPIATRFYTNFYQQKLILFLFSHPPACSNLTFTAFKKDISKEKMPVAWHPTRCHATGIFSLLISFLNA